MSSIVVGMCCLRPFGRRAGRDRHHHRRRKRRLRRGLARRHDHRHIPRAAGRSGDERHECARGVSVQHAPAGRLRVGACRRPGFTTYVEKDLWVTVGGTIERNVTLGVAPVAETITVSGETPVVDPRQTGVARSLGREAVETIPTARQRVTAYLGTLPGVALGNYNSGTNPVIMGSNSTDSSYMVDGMLTNHPSNGLAWAYYDMDAAEEINLVALGASAEYQQAQGGVMNYVSKAGTNVYRGDGSIYWAPPGLTSVPVTRPCNCPHGRNGIQAVQVSRLLPLTSAGPSSRTGSGSMEARPTPARPSGILASRIDPRTSNGSRAKCGTRRR